MSAPITPGTPRTPGTPGTPGVAEANATTATCLTHPKVVATGVCRDCLRALCDICTITEMDFVPRCGSCTIKLRRSRMRLRVGATVGVVALAGTMIFLAIRAPSAASLAAASASASAAASADAPGYDYGESESKIRLLIEHLDKEPCDRRKILELIQAMFRAGDGRGSIQRADAFMKKCGDFPRLRWVTYEAHKQYGEWDEAIADANKLIESSPYDADFHGWRGLAHEQKGAWALAANDYRQAMVIKPRLTDLPINLANMYERQGKLCEAMWPLEQVAFFHPDADNIGAIHARIADLASKGGCANVAGEGRAVIRINPVEGVIRTAATLNGQESGTFLVDTGASYVTLSRAMADRLALDLNGASALFVQTANGVLAAQVVTLGTVQVQGAKADQVQAVVVEEVGTGVDGLLGLSFLSRFDLTQANNTLQIAARKR